MACRVGITTDVETRKSDWEGEYPTMTNWKILAQGLSRDEAQKMEDSFAFAHSCEASPGGNEPDDPNATWSVYRFEF